MILSKDQIFKAPIPTLEVEVPEWGGTVKVRALSALARMQVMDAIFTNEEAVAAYKEDNTLPKVEAYDQNILGVIYSIIGEDNEPIFSIDDYAQVATLNYPTLLHVWIMSQSLENRKPFETKKKSSA